MDETDSETSGSITVIDNVGVPELVIILPIG